MKLGGSTYCCCCDEILEQNSLKEKRHVCAPGVGGFSSSWGGREREHLPSWWQRSEEWRLLCLQPTFFLLPLLSSWGPSQWDVLPTWWAGFDPLSLHWNSPLGSYRNMLPSTPPCVLIEINCSAPRKKKGSGRQVPPLAEKLFPLVPSGKGTNQFSSLEWHWVYLPHSKADLVLSTNQTPFVCVSVLWFHLEFFCFVLRERKKTKLVGWEDSRRNWQRGKNMIKG